MAQLRTERILGEVLDGLASCLRTKLAEQKAETCFTSMIPGHQVVDDYCDCSNEGCGQATVRVTTVFPSSKFPTPDNGNAAQGTGGSCGAPLVATIELAIRRCEPTGDGQGNPPTILQQTTAALRVVGDIAIIRAAVECCDAVTSRTHQLGSWTPLPSTGGCGGGSWPLNVSLVR